MSQLITTYFKYTEDGSGNLVIKNDDEAVYRLISEGMKKFMDTGDVFVSESFKKIRVLPPVSTSVQVRTLGRWLELEVDTGRFRGKNSLRCWRLTERKRAFTG